MKLSIVCCMLFYSGAVPAKGIPLKDGRYQIIGEVLRCKEGSKLLCAVVDKGSRSEKKLNLEPSDWDVSLASIMGLKVVLVGTIKEARLTVQEVPKL